MLSDLFYFFRGGTGRTEVLSDLFCFSLGGSGRKEVFSKRMGWCDLLGEGG